MNQLAKTPQWGQTELEICRFIYKPVRFDDKTIKLDDQNPIPKLAISTKRFREYGILVAEHRHIFKLINELSNYSYHLHFDKYLLPKQYELCNEKGKTLAYIEIIKVGNAFLQFLQANHKKLHNLINRSQTIVAYSKTTIVNEGSYPSKILARFRYKPKGYHKNIRYTKLIKLPTFQELWNMDYEGKDYNFGVDGNIEIIKKNIAPTPYFPSGRIEIGFAEYHLSHQDLLGQFIELLSELYENQKSEVDLDGYLNTWMKRILHDFEEGKVRL